MRTEITDAQHIPLMEEVDGNSVPTLGCAEVEVGIGAGMYVSSGGQHKEGERLNFIPGVVFPDAHDCDLSLQQKFFTVGEHKVECIPERVRVSHAKLKLARQVELPLDLMCW